ncbi:unnamed protein product [Paramecium sonneborni]|uniref:Tetratricopeptide repeat protein n=1 Tax=Paramecium sonneborni TaxID=65129 RepID=A0A8S1RLH7_9CILI|nr:unnamed protein product [Paramecium sonneborni]
MQLQLGIKLVREIKRISKYKKQIKRVNIRRNRIYKNPTDQKKKDLNYLFILLIQVLSNQDKVKEAIDKSKLQILKMIQHGIGRDQHYLFIQIVNNLNKYQEAIDCYDKSIAIIPKNDMACSNKGYALHNLKNNIDAILFYDKALSIKITSLRLMRKADSLFELGKKQEAKQFYQAALVKGSNDKVYIQKQLQML